VYGPVAGGILCDELGFRQSSTSASTGGTPLYDIQSGTGPIFIPRLLCSTNSTGTDQYLECLNEVNLGLSDCDHSRDVGVLCEAYCPDESTTLLQGHYEWTEREATAIQSFLCQYNGTLTEGGCDITEANATRRCSEYGRWEEPDVSNCISEATAMLCDIRNMEVTDADDSLMALELVLEQATDPSDRSSTNLDTITSIFHTVAESDSIEINRDAFETATTILSQIQSWGVDNTTRATLQNGSAE
jgi:hypothetical protein